MDVAEHWGRIVQWLADHAPVTYAPLIAGSAEQDIVALQQELGFELPVDLRTWWTLCGGTRDRAFAEVLPPFYTPYSAADALDARRMWMKITRDNWGAVEAEPEAGSMAWSWHPAFVPIAFDGCGNDLVVDLRPGELHGCVKEHDHEEGALRKPEWPSLTVMLDEVATALEYRTTVNYCHPNVTVEGRLDWRTN
ncbi:SMI1/KNR4 family protein [Goodfellowiella coeruleoviolacea]|uniref:SMI1/KNR4 family protein n=1 Tax=Goodfellowiella coeruleoviolacea TaxID=334858 RepID=UPI000AC386DD|nr:SMI1/KNR4 family protein [Goodfellowiella coeruleoviolacea]